MSEFYIASCDILKRMGVHVRLSRAIMTLQPRLQRVKDCYIGGALVVDDLAYLEFFVIYIQECVRIC